MLDKQQYERLLDDIKLISKACKVMGRENDQLKREFALGLVEDLTNRLHNDILEMKKNF